MSMTVALCALTLLGSEQAVDQYRPKVGEKHRPFVLPEITSRKPVSLADYRGRKVLLLQFASW